MSIITSANTINAAFNVISDTTGNLSFQVGSSTTALTINQQGAIGPVTGSTPNYGTSGQVLTSSGSGGVPSWATLTIPVNAVVSSLIESANVISSVPAANTNVYLGAGTQSVIYYTSNAVANWNVNVTSTGSQSLNTLLSTNQSISTALFVTNGSSAYYPTAFTIDGATVVPKWQGGNAPTNGNASGIDVYTYTITKTASSTYTVLASQTQFK